MREYSQRFCLKSTTSAKGDKLDLQLSGVSNNACDSSLQQGQEIEEYAISQS